MVEKKPEMDTPQGRVIPENINEYGEGHYIVKGSEFPSLPNEPEPQSRLNDHQEVAPGHLTDHTYRRERRRNHKPSPRTIKNVAKLALVAMAVYGGYSVVNGLFSVEGNSFEGSEKVENTRVYEYSNVPLELAGIESDISLRFTAGEDRTNIGPIKIPGVDLSPVNNMYDFNQKGLTTETQATLIVEDMKVQESSDSVIVTLDGKFNLGATAIDWDEQDFAGSDIQGASLSFGNELKDKLDNAALEIMQDGGRVAAACAVNGKDVQPVLTTGVKEFLKIVNSKLFRADKPLKVQINDLDVKAKVVYGDEVSRFSKAVGSIKQKFSGKNDKFSLDISGITDCEKQDIRIIKADPKENKK